MGVHLFRIAQEAVANAVKHSQAGRIEIGLTTEGAGLTLRVSDNGVGITTEHQAHIFDRFYQVEQSRNRLNSADGDANNQESSGTGLGLAIAKWIARANNGEIRVQSVVGQGSTFEVTLPVDS